MKILTDIQTDRLSIDSCINCYACFNVCNLGAVSIKNIDGKMYPIIDEVKCNDCGKCTDICTIKKEKALVLSDTSKKHIGIINLSVTHNYGAVIAAAVLEDIVRNIVGDDFVVETMNYAPQKNYTNPFEKLHDEIKDAWGLKLYIKGKIQKRQDSPQNKEQEKIRIKKFYAFRDRFLNRGAMLRKPEELNKRVNYSAFICGSDIVWAPKRVNSYGEEGYFLTFANNGEKRIAFAPSIDCKPCRKLYRLKNTYKENIKDIDYISVREKTNVSFIQGLTDKKVYECCDPAFLVEADYYDKMIDFADIQEDDKPYIYVYILEVNQEIVDYASKLAKEKGMKVCYYSKYHNSYGCEAVDCNTDSPAEFLYRLKNAEYVLTNSFHCLVFSLLFQKQFLSFTRSKISIKSTDLLEKFGLLDRVITDKNIISIDKPIDFDEVDKIINEMRTNALDYLKDALCDI